ncbi:NUDIX domain-containing protein [Corynebacterium glucuronolyticum]
MFTVIRNADIEKSLSTATRQYLAGDLKRPQELPFVKQDAVECGITDYSEYATEKPHFHTEALEFQYVVSGWTQYLDVETGEKLDFFAGDFYAIHPGTTYAQKSKPGTRIFFVKVPSVNDKQVVKVNDEVASWFETPLRGSRTDYFHEEGAPAPNSLRPAVAVAVLHGDRVLVIKRRDNGRWSLPGGTLEYGESLPDCAVREMREETGLVVTVDGVIGTFTDPDIRIAYTDGEVRQEFTLVFAGTVRDATEDLPEVTIDDESTDIQWVPLADVESLPMAASHERRMKAVAAYMRDGRQTIN